MANELRIIITADDKTDRTFNAVERKVRSSFGARMRTAFGRVGTTSGAAFTAGFIKTVTFGQVGRGFAFAAIKTAPQMAKAGAVMGAALAGALILEVSTAITATLPLVVGSAMLALPIFGIIKKMVDTKKEIEKIDTKILVAQEKVTRSTGKAREEAEKELKILKEQKKELEKQAKPLLDLQDHWGSFMKQISKPVKPFVIKSMEIIGSRLDEWAPKVKKAMDFLAPALLPFTSGVLTGIENFFKAIAKDMPSIKAGMEAWGDNFGKIGTAFGEMVAEIMKDPKATVQAIEDFVETLEDLARVAGDVLSAVGDLAAKWQGWNRKFTKIRDEHNEIIAGFNFEPIYDEERDGSLWQDIINDFKFYGESIEKLNKKIEDEIKELREKIPNALDDLNKKIEDKIKELRGKIVDKFEKIWDDAKTAFKEGMGDVVDDVKRWYHKVVDWFQKLYDKLVGKSIVPDLIDEIVRLFKTLPGRIGDEVEKMKDRALAKFEALKDKAVEKIERLKDSALAKFEKLKDDSLAKIERLKDDSLAKIERLKDSALAKWEKLKDDTLAKIERLKDGVRTKFEKMKDDALAKLESLKDNAIKKGKAVIDGFLGGMKDKFDKVKTWVSGIAKWIKDHKGPISLDRQLLQPAGKALMGGLLEGLKFGFGGVGDFVYKAGTSIKDIIGQIKESFLGDWSGKIGKITGGRNRLLSAIANTFGIGGGTYPGHGERGAAKSWDFMARGRLGDAIASFAKTFARQLGVLYVIWNRRIWNIQRASEGWRPYTRSNPHTDHVHVSLMDKGGMLRSGGAAFNMSGQPERILSPAQTRSFDRMVRVMDRGGGTGSTYITINAPNYVGSQDDLRRTLVDMNRRGQLEVIKR